MAGKYKVIGLKLCSERGAGAAQHLSRLPCVPVDRVGAGVANDHEGTLLQQEVHLQTKRRPWAEALGRLVQGTVQETARV